jgi:hypothetical protein
MEIPLFVDGDSFICHPPGPSPTTAPETRCRWRLAALSGDWWRGASFIYWLLHHLRQLAVRHHHCVQKGLKGRLGLQWLRLGPPRGRAPPAPPSSALRIPFCLPAGVCLLASARKSSSSSTLSSLSFLRSAICGGASGRLHSASSSPSRARVARSVSSAAHATRRSSAATHPARC